MIDIKKVVANIDCSNYKDKKPEKIVLDILNTENNNLKYVSIKLTNNPDKVYKKNIYESRKILRTKVFRR